MLFSPNRPGRMRRKTLSWERVAGRSPDGCGAVQGLTWYRPFCRRESPALSCLERVAPQGRVWRGPLSNQTGLCWMGASYVSRRGRCPHRPDGPMVETVRLYLPVSPVRLRDDEGIVPYASVKPYRSAKPGLNFQGSPPHPSRAAPGPPSPSRRGLFCVPFAQPLSFCGGHII